MTSMDFDNYNYTISAEKLNRIVSRVYAGHHPAEVLGQEHVGTMDFIQAVSHIPHRSKELDMAVLTGSEFKPTDQRVGAWFVFGLDAAPYPIGLFNDELLAYKCALSKSGHVVFWDFNESWDDIYARYMGRNLPKPNEQGVYS